MTVLKSVLSPVLSNVLSSVLRENLIALNMPSGFEWFTDNYQLFSNNTTNFNISTFRATGLKYYIAPNGNDSNDGLSPASPMLSPLIASQKAGCKQVIAESGRYWNSAWGNTGISIGVSVVCESGFAELMASNEDDTSNFSPDGVNIGAHKWTGAGTVRSVWDESIPNSFGGWGWLVNQSSAANVASLGGWYSDGSDLWVKLTDDRAPDSDVRVNTERNSNTTTGAAGSNYYKNIKFLGHEAQMNAFSGGDGSSIAYYESCVASYTSHASSGGFRCSDATAYYQDCDTFSNYNDGFSGSNNCRVVEIDCEAYDFRLTGSNNASTIHGTGKAIRIGGDYHDTNGSAIAEINETSSFNLGIDVHNGGFQASFGDYLVSPLDSEVGSWLINCTNGTVPGPGDYSVASSSSGPGVFVQNSVFLGDIDGAPLTDVILY